MNANTALSPMPQSSVPRSNRSWGSFALSAVVLATCATTVGCGDDVRKTDSESRAYEEALGIVLIDNMEDNNTQTLADRAGYLGFWYTYDDRKDCREDFCCQAANGGTLTDTCADDTAAMCPGAMAPVPEDMDFPMSSTAGTGFAVAPGLEEEVAASTFAAHISGGGYGTWGAGMGVNLNDNQAYDVTVPTQAEDSFIGIRFLAATGLGAQAVNVKVQDVSGKPDGGMCAAKMACGETQGCFADWGKVINLTSTWTEYRILFSEFTLPGFEVWKSGVTPPTAIDLANVYQIQFQTDGSMDGAEFDIWIDNLAFIQADGTTVPAQ